MTYQTMSWSTLRYNFLKLFQFNHMFSVIFHFGVCLRQSPRLFESKFHSVDHMSFLEWTGDSNNIHHWSWYWKLSWVVFQPTTTQFHLDVRNVWPNRPWVQLALRTNFLRLLQYHHLFSVIFHFGLRLCQLPHLLELKFCWRNHMSVAEWIQDANVNNHWRILWSSYRELNWVGFKPTATKFCSEVLTDWPSRRRVHQQ